VKPLNITLSAFGPFAEKTEIELNKFGNKGIYLITGDTGAGKTTVFDAICYALYGEASGKYRSKAASYRCAYAKPDTPTYVKLVFEYNGDEYTLTRNPEYTRPKTKGEGTTLETAKAELIYPDGRVLTKVGDVTRAIEELIGLNHDQFTQISMLAQGDFQRLLNADTKERIDIFRRIFNTELYQVFQDRLSEKQSSLNKDWNEQIRSVAQLIDSVVCMNDEQQLKIDELKESGVYMIDSVCMLLQNMIDSDKQLSDKSDVDIKKYDDLIVKVNSDISVANEIIKLFDSAAEYKQKQTEYIKKCEIAESGLNEHLLTKEGRDKLSDSVAVITSQLDKYTALDELLNEGKSVKQQIELMQKQASDFVTQCEKATNELNLSKQRLKELDNVQRMHADALLEYEAIKQQLSALSELSALYDELSNAKRDYKLSLEKYESSQKIYSTARSEYAIMEDVFLNGQAGLLAKHLEADKPCPVCGSTNHPAPAQMITDMPEQSELDDKKQQLELLQADAQNTANIAQKAKGICETLNQKVVDKASALFGETDSTSDAVKNKLTKLNIVKAELIAKITDLDNKCKKRELLNKQIPELENTVTNLSASVAELNSKLAKTEERRAQLRTRYSEMSSGLKYKTKSDALASLEMINKQIADWDAKQKQLQTDFDNCNKTLSEINANIKVVNERIKNVDKPNVDLLTERKSVLEAERKTLQNNRERIIVRMSNNESVCKSIRTKGKELDNLAARLKIINSLNDTANGRISGKDKLGFETYIQIKWFDRIIVMANQRFSAMTNGQYSLVRKSIAENRQIQSGLELDVIDHRNGTSRSVKTLSGGESFKASLSLALGLSDVVQSVSGGVHLDAMYIDEGFGSLDEESLSQAVNVLRKLSDDNRIVGIISHVAELKERFDRHLIVSKDDNGISRVRIEV